MGAVIRDQWHNLQNLTPARIALGRAGTSLPTRAHLGFQFDHAKARKAVHLEFDTESLGAGLAALGLEVLTFESAAADRSVYLQRPDLGRRLSDASQAALQTAAGAAQAEAAPYDLAPYDLAIVIADGLSAQAVQENATGFLAELLPELRRAGWRIAPVSLVRQGRVAIADEIGAAFQARHVIILIGERPGLSSPDSMGIYMTFQPRIGLTDEMRNCISNIRKAGLSWHEAAWRLCFLLREADQRGLSGVLLKDDAEMLAPDAALPLLAAREKAPG